MKKKGFEGYQKKSLSWWVGKTLALIVSLMAGIATYIYLMDLFN